MELAGIEKNRLHLQWLSSAEASRFQKIVIEVTDAVKCCGKFNADKFKLQLDAAKMTTDDKNIRWLMGKEIPITTKGDIYGRDWKVEDYKSVLFSILQREYEKNLIYLAVKQNHTSVRDISKFTGINLLRISYLISDMEKKQKIEFTGMKDRKPVFAAL